MKPNISTMKKDNKIKTSCKLVRSLLYIISFLFTNQIISQTTYTFNYTGNIQTFTLQPGTYSVQMWGGNGEQAVNQPTGGVGGYSSGTYSVGSTTIVYIAVGGKGGLSPSTAAFAAGGWNGGGQGYGSTVIGAGGGGVVGRAQAGDNQRHAAKHRQTGLKAQARRVVIDGRGVVGTRDQGSRKAGGGWRLLGQRKARRQRLPRHRRQEQRRQQPRGASSWLPLR